MLIPPPARRSRIIEFLKPYVLKMHFSNQFVSAQVNHHPTATVASSASSQEKILRDSMECGCCGINREVTRGKAPAKGYPRHHCALEQGTKVSW